jgi:hypothetical protein
MSKDELIRQLSMALSGAREVIKHAVPRSESSDWWQRDSKLLEVAQESFARSLEKKNASGSSFPEASGTVVPPQP